MTARLPVALALAALAAAAAPPPALAQRAGVEELPAVEYARPEGVPLLMDVYVPPGRGPHPGVMVVHGGGFRRGDRSRLQSIARTLAAQGYVAFSIDYRLAPQNPFPAAVEDALAAIVYVRAHADELKLDPARVGALGSSAGGTVASSVGVMCGRGGSGGRLAAVVSWSGAQDLFRTASESRSARAPVLGYVLGDERAPLDDGPAFEEASPISHVDGEDPPMFIANSTEEIIPFDQAEAMAAELRSAGVPVELFRAPPGRHGAGYARDVLPGSLEFLDRHVRAYDGSERAPESTCALEGPGPGSGPGGPGDGGGPGSALVLLAVAGIGLVAAAGVVLAVRARWRAGWQR